MNFRVKEICKSKGVTMESVANELGITANTLTRNINGNPTIETLEKIASALDVPFQDLFTAPSLGVIACPACGAVINLSASKAVD